MGPGNPAIDATGNREGFLLVDVRMHPYKVFYNGAWYAMFALAVFLLIVCSLLAGLTLAVCGLNMTFLQLRSVTGSSRQRQQALVVARMKRHSTWMLCSLILVSIACGESLPFIIQSLWDGPQQWVPIFISTAAIAIFAEILPQYVIPRHPIAWGYYCWPMIWGCMWITGIFTYPLAWLLDHIAGSRREHGLCSNDELAGLIKFHGKSDMHGGLLGRDATRVMLGALSLDSQRIGENVLTLQEKGSNESENDIEKADVPLVHGMIVKWSAVKTIDIDEPVDKAFIRKIRAWSYSRIPVIGEAQAERTDPGDNSSRDTSWDGKKVFGFLHIQNLVGLDIKDKSGMCVRDLPLYPLPIVRDNMEAYALLNMFQIGMSRMAVVIQAPLTPTINPVTTPKNPHDPSQLKEPCWTGTHRTNFRIMSRMKRVNGQVDWTKDWTNDFLKTANAGIENPKHHQQNVIGIRCPDPIGIVTFEDIIDTILQKTSWDERDFFDRDNAVPRTKGKKTGDCLAISKVIAAFQGDDDGNVSVPAYVHHSHLHHLRSLTGDILRKRNPSNKENIAAAMDGADEHGDDRAGHEIKMHKIRNELVESSYTLNSRGGFHAADESANSLQNTVVSLTSEDLTDLRTDVSTSSFSSDSPLKSVSLPSRKAKSPVVPGQFKHSSRHMSASPRLPQLRRVATFSNQQLSSDKKKASDGSGRHDLVLPVVPIVPISPKSSSSHSHGKLFGSHDSGKGANESLERSSIHEDARGIPRQGTGEAILLESWACRDRAKNDGQNRALFKSSVVDSTPTENDESIHVAGGNRPKGPERTESEPYGGFPPELLDNRHVKMGPYCVSNSLPRMHVLQVDNNTFSGSHNHGTPVRENIFHDDRAVLPSQRRVVNDTAIMGVVGARSSSFWV